MEQITGDLRQLQNYSQEMEKAKDLWRDQVQSYKRNRRLQGRGELFSMLFDSLLFVLWHLKLLPALDYIRLTKTRQSI